MNEKAKLVSKNQKKVANYSNQLKRRITRHEQIIYDLLIDNNILFQFQKIVYNHKVSYILDFYFKSTENRRYCIEIDGNSHNSERQKLYDKKRTWWLENRRKMKVIRFTNTEVDENPFAIIEIIKSYKPKIYSEQ